MGLVAGEESRKLGFSILRATYSVGGILNFFLASVMPVYVNLILLIVVLPVSIFLYVVGELVYAKDRVRIFPCCREVVSEEEKEEKSFETQSLGPNGEGCYIYNGVYFETPL